MWAFNLQISLLTLRAKQLSCNDASFLSSLESGSMLITCERCLPYLLSFLTRCSSVLMSGFCWSHRIELRGISFLFLEVFVQDWNDIFFGHLVKLACKTVWIWCYLWDILNYCSNYINWHGAIKISISFEVIPHLQEFVCLQIHVFELITSLLFLCLFLFLSRGSGYFWTSSLPLSHSSGPFLIFYFETNSHFFALLSILLTQPPE